MRAKQFFISTLKEAPADAEVVSQQLMLRAGMIRRLAAGIYNYMPMGLRSLRKIEKIIREEMDAAGAIELLTPVVQPAELWMETGRWNKYGPELLRIKDRHDRDFVLQPTSEEVLTDIARQEIRSWKQLPVTFYQIQTKFRDERRPRFGLMRGREFIMKDAYSFDKTEEDAKKSYENMYRAYCRIFDRLGLKYRAVRADSGSIGGNHSQEFQVIAETGEDVIVYCPESDFAANIELAPAPCLIEKRRAPQEEMKVVPTPGKSTCEDMTEFLGVPLTKSVKSVVVATDEYDDEGNPLPSKVYLLLIRGDHTLNEVKAGKLPQLKKGFRFATEKEILENFGSKPGYLGPVNMIGDVEVIADTTVANMSDFIVGANKEDHHITGVNWGRDLPEPQVADLRNVVEGDASPCGKGVLSMVRGIEVGHVFYLGTRYSEPMKATFLDVNGKPLPLEMGSYGIGVSRLLGAAIEQAHDEKGIIWPDSIAPFTLAICPVGYDKSDSVKTAADKLYTDLKNLGVDVILDDRGLRPGVMFAEWELIGVPHRVTIGDRGLKNGEVEYAHRADLKNENVPVENVLEFLKGKLNI